MTRALALLALLVGCSGGEGDDPPCVLDGLYKLERRAEAPGCDALPDVYRQVYDVPAAFPDGSCGLYGSEARGLELYELTLSCERREPAIAVCHGAFFTEFCSYGATLRRVVE